MSHFADKKKLIIKIREFASEFGKSNIRQFTLPLLQKKDKHEFIQLLNALDKVNLNDPKNMENMADKSHEVLLKVMEALDVQTAKPAAKPAEKNEENEMFEDMAGQTVKIKKGIENAMLAAGWQMNEIHVQH